MSKYKSKKDMYKQIYKVTYVANIHGMIDESKYINVLQKLSMSGFKTYHISDFEKLTMHMENIGLYDSFNISLLLHLRDTNYKKMSEIAIRFEDIGKIFSVKKIMIVDRIHKIRNVIKNKLDVQKSFKRIDTLNNFNLNLKMDGDNICKNKYLSTTKIEDEWQYHTRNDIMNRLHLLCQKYYTLEQLKFMNVELKYVSEINTYSHKQLETFYMNVMKNIENSFKDWMTICKMYIDIEVNYSECCNNMITGTGTNLNLKHFNIDIKNST